MVAPEVSVVTTVYNGERFLAESLESVLAQDEVEFELVVVDDGSTDGTPAILDRLSDPRLVVLGRPRRGRPVALNEAIAQSRGRYVAVHDADDRCLPGRLAVPFAYLEDHHDVDLVGSGEWVFIDAAGEPLGRRPAGAVDDAGLRRLLARHRAPFAHSSATMRRDALTRVGGYDEALLVDLDLDLYVRLAEHGRLATVPDPLVATRRHDGQFFAGRRGATRRLRDRVASRRIVDRRSRAILAGQALPPGVDALAASAREAGAWVYWRGRRVFGSAPVLPRSVRRRLDRWWSRGRVSA